MKELATTSNNDDAKLCVGTLLVNRVDLQALTTTTAPNNKKTRTTTPTPPTTGNNSTGGVSWRDVFTAVSTSTTAARKTRLQRRATEMMDGVSSGRQVLKKRATEPAESHIVERGDADTNSWIASAWLIHQEEQRLRRRNTKPADNESGSGGGGDRE